MIWILLIHWYTADTLIESTWFGLDNFLCPVSQLYGRRVMGELIYGPVGRNEGCKHRHLHSPPSLISQMRTRYVHRACLLWMCWYLVQLCNLGIKYLYLHPVVVNTNWEGPISDQLRLKIFGKGWFVISCPSTRAGDLAGWKKKNCARKRRKTAQGNFYSINPTAQELKNQSHGTGREMHSRLFWAILDDHPLCSWDHIRACY